MINGTQNQYTPDYVSPPGETLMEKIEELDMSQAELAQRLGRPKKTVNEIIRGKAAITPRTALQLERVLGIPASFWNNREQQYRQYLARKEEENNLRDHTEWLRRFSIKSMIKLGWIQASDDEVRQLRELLDFFGVASPEQWDSIWSPSSVVFRKARTFDSAPGDLSAWLRRGELEAQEIPCRPYSGKVFHAALRNMRNLTVEPPEIFQPKLVNLCAEGGVAVVFVPQLPKVRVSGATRWLSPSKALIQLSLRYKKDDQLWFTFFHEAGHILRHGKRDVFIEDDESDDVKEKEANEFARETLIPSSTLDEFLDQWTPGKYPSKQAILDFAESLGIAPGIVVGRLQHDGHVPYTHYNQLKRTFSWAD